MSIWLYILPPDNNIFIHSDIKPGNMVLIDSPDLIHLKKK
jgi:hypothetical protein